MRIFHELVADTHLEGGISFAPSRFSQVSRLARAHTIRFHVVADTVSGSFPTLTLLLLESPDAFIRVYDTKTLLDAVALSGTAVNQFTASLSAADLPISKYTVLAAFLGGTLSKAHVRIWATGRAPYRMPPEPTPPRTFGDELEHARREARSITNDVDG